MKKIFIIVILLCSSALSAYEKCLGPFQVDAYFRYPLMKVDADRIYVMDKKLLKGFIFERKSLKKIAEFGGKGESPMEFTGIGDFSIDDNNIYVCGMTRLSIFSKDGKYLKGFRIPFNAENYIPLGNNRYISTIHIIKNIADTSRKFQFNLYTDDALYKRNFYSIEFPATFRYEDGKEYCYFPEYCVKAKVYKEKIFFGNSSKGFYFAVFDRDGNSLYEIKLNAPKKHFSDFEKKSFMNMLKQDSVNKMGRVYKREVVIRDEIPPYIDFFVADDRIYAFTEMVRFQMELYVLDLKGKLIQKKEFFFGMTKRLPIGANSPLVDNGKLLFIGDKEIDGDDASALYEVDLLK